MIELVDRITGSMIQRFGNPNFPSPLKMNINGKDVEGERELKFDRHYNVTEIMTY